MVSKYTRRQLGKVKVGDDISNDEGLHAICRTLLNPTNSQSINHHIIHTKVLVPGDFKNLFEQYQISDRMILNLESFESSSKHVFCDQLGPNLCWRCSRELIDRNMKVEIEKVLPNSDPDVLTRVVCVENSLTNMKLPLFSSWETKQWNNSSQEKSSDNEPLFFPYPSSTPVAYEREKSNEESPTSMDQRHVTFNSTFTEDAKVSTDSRKSIQLIAPPVLMNSNE